MGMDRHPVWPKKLRIRPRGSFFTLRSMRMLPGLEILPKSQKINKTGFIKSRFFEKSSNKCIWIYESIQFCMEDPNWGSKVASNTPRSRFWPFFRNFRIFEKCWKSQGGGSGLGHLDAQNLIFPSILMHWSPLGPQTTLPSSEPPVEGDGSSSPARPCGSTEPRRAWKSCNDNMITIE